MVDNFQTLVEAIVTNPDEQVGKLPLLSASQKHQLLVEWNNTQTDYPHQCIHQLFEQQVERTPNAIAVQWENQQLTYRELNNQANQLSHYLQFLGVSAQTLVGMIKFLQLIAETLSFTLPLVDLQTLAEVEREAELQRLITAEYTEAFDLSQAPLLRVKLIRLESNSHILLVTMHHIISDAWSVAIFFKELSSLYGNSPLANLPVQYADYAYWQRQGLQNDVINTQISYWKQQLADAPSIIELPTDYPRSAVQTFRGSIHRFRLGNDLTNKLKILSQKSGTSLFMTLQAAFVTFLYRYTGQEDIVIGSPITNRNRQALESFIGFFVNTLVLRTRLENNPTFKQLLSQVRQVALDAYVHQDLPFDTLVEALQPKRHKNLSPLFQVMFVLQNSPLEKFNLPGLNVTQIELNRPTAGANFDLTLSMQEVNLELIGAFEYNANLFDTTTIARMVDNFQTLVESIVSNPDEKVGELPLLSAAQKHQLLVEWNNTQTDYPHQCIHQLFEQQVERTPDAIYRDWETDRKSVV